MTFEESMNSLEDVIKELESETTSLEEMINYMKKELSLRTRICKNHLKMLSKSNNPC